MWLATGQSFSTLGAYALANALPFDSFAIASVVCAQERMEQPHEEARPRLIQRLQARGLLNEDITNG